jgi:hypothetical protein
MSAAEKRLRRMAHTRHARRCRLSYETLEPRLALDAEGALAGVDPHLTLSFADDGVPIAGQVSALETTFDSVASSSVWREQILRAFQTWAVLTNSDIGVVADGGQEFGSPGAKQRDDRFGDIRVGAIATSPEVGAVSVPVTNVVSGTWLADVIFNTQFDYQTLDDILAVAMHEAGNVFGLEDSADPDSPLFTGGPPTVKSPTATDIANLQSLHGVRAPDLNESHQNDNGEFNDNDTFVQATELKLVEPTDGDEGFAPTIVYGDVGSTSDVDYFSIVTPGGYSGSVTFNVRSAGVSLLQPDVTIFDATQQQVAHVSSQLVGGANVTIQIPSTAPHELLFVRVTAADPGAFGIGGYSLVAKFDGINVVEQETIDSLAGGAYRNFNQEDIAKFFEADENEFFNDDAHSDDSAALGTELETAPGFADGTRYVMVASIADATDVDYYIVKSPQSGAPGAGVLTASIRSLEAGGLTPEILVFDEDLHPLSTEILVNGGGELLVQVLGTEAEAEYVVGVRAAHPAGPFNTGNYELSVVFSGSSVELQSLAQGTVGGTSAGRLHTLYIGQTQLFHFIFETGPAETVVPTAAVVTIRDEDAEAVATFASPPGELRSPSTVLLEPGTYTIEVFALTLDGSTSPPLDYSLLGTSISDPFVGDPADPNSHPFACMDPELAGFFCYPGDIISPDPFLWDDFVADLSDPPPPLDLTQLIDLLIGDWWSWVWHEFGTNGPPLAQDDTFFTLQAAAGAALPYGDLGPASNVLVNDIDPEGDSIVAALSSGPVHGTVALLPDGTFNYVPAPGFVGTDKFTYVANDFTQSSNEATVRIVVGSELPGDYDANGIVDDGDYLAWRASFGSVDELLADGSRNGTVDSIDYVVWRSHLGATLGGATALAVNADVQRSAVVVIASEKSIGQPLNLVGARQQGIIEASNSGLVATSRTRFAKNAFNQLRVVAAQNASRQIGPSLLLARNLKEDLSGESTSGQIPKNVDEMLTDAVFDEWPSRWNGTLRAGATRQIGALGRWRL